MASSEINFNDECIRAESEAAVVPESTVVGQLLQRAANGKTSRYPQVEYQQEYTEHIRAVLLRGHNKPITMQQLVSFVAKSVHPQRVPREEYMVVRSRIESLVRKSLIIDKNLFKFDKIIEDGHEVTKFSLNMFRNAFVNNYSDVLTVNFAGIPTDIEVTVGFAQSLAGKAQSIENARMNREHFGAIIAVIKRTFE